MPITPTSQINLKLDPNLKKQSEVIAKKLGFSLSSILRGFLASFVRDRQISFSLKNKKESGSKLTQELIAAGFSEKYAKEHGRAYNAMLDDEKNDNLTRW